MEEKGKSKENEYRKPFYQLDGTIEEEKRAIQELLRKFIEEYGEEALKEDIQD